MKKLKDSLLIVSFTYMIFIVLLILVFLVFKRPYFKLNMLEDEVEEFATRQVKIENLKDSECKNELKKLIEEYSKDSANGKFRINKLNKYIDTEKQVSPYYSIKDKCNFSNRELLDSGVPHKFVVLMETEDKIVMPYMYQFELGFIDEMSLSYYEENTNIAYKSLKQTQLEILDGYIDMIGEN